MANYYSFEVTVAEIKAARGIDTRRHSEAKILDAHVCFDLSNEHLNSGWNELKVASGREMDLIKSLEHKICKKTEATARIIIGEIGDGGFIRNKSKHYWLRRTQ